MGSYNIKKSISALLARRVLVLAQLLLLILMSGIWSRPARAAIPWDGEAGTQWWFDPVNWNRDMNTNTTLPPGNATSGATDTQINNGTLNLLGGEGVVYDPALDPNFPPAASITFPAGYDAQTINQLYISRDGQSGVAQPTPSNLLTIKSGSLTANGQVVVARSSGIRDVATFAQVTQKGGTFSVPNSSLDIAQTDTSHPGYGNATYDYQGGTLNVSATGGNGLRLSNGSSSVTSDANPAGAAGVAKLIVHNPTTGGFIRSYDVASAAYSGVADGLTNSYDPDGITKGVAIFEFHYENGGVRPIQVGRNLAINNGIDGSGATPTMGTRSSRLDLKLDTAPTVTAGVPANIGLFDVDFDQTDLVTGAITGTGDIDGDGIYNDDRVFSNANAPNPLAVSAAYYQDSIVSAVFGSTKYNWKISYTGVITWSDPANSVVQSITQGAAGSGATDVVLIGLSTESVGIAGDFNNDGKVDAGDYVTWRKNNGTNNALANDNGLGTPIGPSHYALWRANYGKPPGAGSGLSASSVPEPQSCWLALCFIIGGVLAHRKR
jgi:hypothetical protein